MAKFRRSPKFGRNHSCLGSLDGVQFTHPLAEITKLTRWGPAKVQVTLKPFRGSRINHIESSLPTLGSFRYPQGVQNGPFGLKQMLTGRKPLYSEKSTLQGYDKTSLILNFLFLVGAGSASPSSIMDSEKYQSLIWMKDFFLKRTNSNKIEFLLIVWIGC